MALGVGAHWTSSSWPLSPQVPDVTAFVATTPASSSSAVCTVGADTKRAELYTLTDADTLCACVILNSAYNEGYVGCPWSLNCVPEDVLIPHALAVNPTLQGRGVRKIVVENILALARAQNKKAVRLDVLSACKAAERLYTACGFRFAEAKTMYYEDTGWTEFKMFELNL